MVGILVLIWTVLFSTFKGNDPFAEVTWNYDPQDSDKGQDNWGTIDSTCNKEMNPMQSPVNIDTGNVKNESKPAMCLEFINYSEWPHFMTLTNEGNALSLTASYYGNEIPSVKFNDTIYQFKEINFHWGVGEHDGTEHTIDNKGNCMEIQVLHKGPEDKLLVAAILLKVRNAAKVLRGFERISVSLGQVKEAESYSYVNEFPLEEFLPKRLTWTDFYWYKGSLTMPPCTPDVVWCVQDTSYNIRENEMDMFRALEDEHGKSISGNTREVQKREELVVTHVKKQTQIDYSDFMEGYSTETSRGSSVRMSHQIRHTFYVTSMVILFVAK